MEQQSTPQQKTPAAVGAAPGLLEQLVDLGQEWAGRAHDHLTLAALETRLAGRSLVIMIAAGVMIAVLLISAWLGLMAAMVLWLSSLGVAVAFGLILCIGANLALAVVLAGLVRRQSHNLRFPATLRSLRPATAGAARKGIPDGR